MSPAEMGDDQIDAMFNQLVEELEDDTDTEDLTAISNILRVQGDRIHFEWDTRVTEFLRGVLLGMIDGETEIVIRRGQRVYDEDGIEETEHAQVAREVSAYQYDEGVRLVLDGLERGWVAIDEAPRWVMVLNATRLSIMTMTQVEDHEMHEFLAAPTMPSAMCRVCLGVSEALLEILNG